LALDQQLVSVISFLVDPIKVVGVFDRNELWDRAFFKNFLSSLSDLLAEHFLLLGTAKRVSLFKNSFFLQALCLQNISCLIELVIVGAVVQMGAAF